MACQSGRGEARQSNSAAPVQASSRALPTTSECARPPNRRRHRRHRLLVHSPRSKYRLLCKNMALITLGVGVALRAAGGPFAGSNPRPPLPPPRSSHRRQAADRWFGAALQRRLGAAQSGAVRPPRGCEGADCSGGERERGTWSKPPIRYTVCCSHPLAGVPCMRPGPHRWGGRAGRRCTRRASTATTSASPVRHLSRVVALIPYPFQ